MAGAEEIKALSKKIFITDAGIVSRYGLQTQKNITALFDDFTKAKEGYDQTIKRVSENAAAIIKTKDERKKRLGANAMNGDRMLIEESIEEISAFTSGFRRLEEDLNVYIEAGEYKLSEVDSLLGRGQQNLPPGLRSPEGELYIRQCRRAFDEKLMSLKTSRTACAQYIALTDIETNNMQSCLLTVDQILGIIIPGGKIDL